MTKRSSKKRFIALAILVTIGVLLSVLKFDIPFTTTTYNGFINAIPLGVDLQGGISAVFEANLPANKLDADLNTAVDATVARIENLLSAKNFIGSTVVRQGNNQIRVEVPNLTNSQEVLRIIGEPASLKFTTEEDANAEAKMTGEHVENATVGYQDANGDGVSDYGVVLQFTDEGTRLFADLTEEISKNSGTIYIYIGEDTNPSVRLSASGAITSGSTFISGDNMNTYESANEFALKILSGSFNTELSLKETTTITATLGKNALLLTSIAVCVALALILILMPILFGDFGFLTDFAIVIFAIIYLFLLQSVPGVQLTLAGFAGIILSLALVCCCAIVTYKKISNEYKVGKKLHMSVKNGFNQAIGPVADLNAICAIGALVLFIVGSGAIKSFALIFLLGTLVSAFVSLWVLRRLNFIYLPLNTNKAKKLKLKREAGVDEIK